MKAPNTACVDCLSWPTLSHKTNLMKLISHRITRALALLGVLSTIHHPLSASAQGTAFTYQGRLNDGSSPATGTYDLRFTIYDAASSGNAVGGPLTNAATAVSNGLFTVTLDFGNSPFSGGAPRWLNIDVRTNGGASFATLNPRQAFTPT